MSGPVRDQYEAYPYPARDPTDERTRLIAGSPSNLAEIDHYVFAGRADFATPFRALIAGGGTGDAAIMLAQQLGDRARERGTAAPGEVVYIDLSGAARGIAEARARERGLTNIAFHQGSLLNLPELCLGDFDYIDCCGVLHHLDDPTAGLKALTEPLRAGGGMGLMVYAPLGRTGVYPAQAMLRGLGGGLPLGERVTLARRLLDAPAGHQLAQAQSLPGRPQEERRGAGRPAAPRPRPGLQRGTGGGAGRRRRAAPGELHRTGALRPGELPQGPGPAQAARAPRPPGARRLRRGLGRQHQDARSLRGEGIEPRRYRGPGGDARRGAGGARNSGAGDGARDSQGAPASRPSWTGCP